MLKINFLYFNFEKLIGMKMGIGDWGLGIGDWGLGVWAQTQNPKTQTQTPLTHI